MIKPAMILIALIGLALLARLDGDGLLARSDVAARALGYEVRVEVKLQRARGVPRTALADTTEWGRICE
jgi:hypothetical protein